MKKKIKYQNQDPFHKRESSRYENPIPSREFILEVLVSVGKPLSRKSLAKKFDLKTEDQLEALRRRLIAMVRDCQVTKQAQGYAALTFYQEQTGTLRIEKDGFGRVVGEDVEVKLPPREIRGLFEGDDLKVRITRYDYEGQAFGQVVEVLNAVEVSLVGRFFKELGQSYVMPLGRRYIQDIHIPKGKTKKALEGDIVQVAIDRKASSAKASIGSIAHVLGDPEREGIEIDIAIMKHHIPHLWPRGLQQEAKKFGSSIPKAEKNKREDLTHIPFVTIDGEDAKDFDDAVFCETRPSGGWRLYVAIADVSHYVKPGSMLDQEAVNRGNSVYFPGFVIPMLPEVLSNGLCSLKPKVDRLTLVCEMLISQEGKVTRSKFYPATIHSHGRLTYTVVAKLLEGNERQQRKYKELLPHLQSLEQMYYALQKARLKRGAIEFDTVETQIMFDEGGKIASILPRERNLAHKLIEESMLAANVSAANFLKRHRMPTLYRVHLPPPEEKLSALRDFLTELGLKLGGGDTPSPLDYSNLIESVKDRSDAKIIQTVLLRSMSQAEYTLDQDGHFGLAYPAYVHFTSPIRRYPDLIVHRQIKLLLNSAKVDRDAWRNELESLGELCSMTERRADDATRDAMLALKCHYMADKVGDCFMSKVTAVTSFGLFVELEDYYVEGLVHVTALGDDYYFFEPFKHRMIGERTGKVFALGDRLEVQLMRVDVESKKIDLELVGKQSSADSPQKKKGRRRKKSRKRS